MNALRDYADFLWSIHCRVANSITPKGFACLWGVLFAATVAGGLMASSLVGTVAMAVSGAICLWFVRGNLTGRFHS